MPSEHGAVEPADILLVEDNPGDVRLTKEAFEDGKISNIRSCSSGSIPIPSSRTDSVHIELFRSAEICTRGGSSPLYSIALLRRF